MTELPWHKQAITEWKTRGEPKKIIVSEDDHKACMYRDAIEEHQARRIERMNDIWEGL